MNSIGVSPTNFSEESTSFAGVIKSHVMKVDRLLEHYCHMDTALRAELLATVKGFLLQGRTVEFRGEAYHHIEDLAVDIEADCVAQSSEANLESQKA